MGRSFDKARLSRKLYRLRNKEPRFAFFVDLLSRVGEWALVGGAVRDWGLGRKARDLDVVVNGDADSLADMIERFSPMRNSYGGYRVAIAGWDIDVWALESTWAFSTGRFARTDFEAFAQSTFFNVDSGVYLWERDSLVECGLLDGLRERVLEVSFPYNPRLDMCAARALRLRERYQLRMGPRILSLVSDQRDVLSASDELGAWQVRRYGRRHVAPQGLSRPVLPFLERQ